MGRLTYYLGYAWRFAVLRRPDPLICGVAIGDRCDFACKGCRVSNTGRPDMTFEAVVDTLSRAYRRGCREAYFTGGEPTLWRDGDHTLSDAIEAARRLGYFHVHVYTNGAHGLDWPADLVWVSMDGLRETFSRRRGDHFDEVERWCERKATRPWRSSTPSTAPPRTGSSRSSPGCGSAPCR